MEDRCCENCGWSEIVGSPIMCNYNGHRTFRDEICPAWKPKGVDKMVVVNLTEYEANILCDFMEDEQDNGEYEHYWSAEQRKALDEVLYKVKCGLVGKS